MAAQNSASERGRKAPGRPFVAGQSGNPGGRPKALKGVEEAARAHTTRALAVLVEVMNSKKSPAVARNQAASILLDRGWGKPKQTQEIEVRADLPAALEAMRVASLANG